MALCPECRDVIDEASDFCASCGHDLSSRPGPGTPPVRYQVIGTTGDRDGPDQVVASFDTWAEAVSFAAFLRGGGKFRRVDIQEAGFEPAGVKPHPSRGAGGVRIRLHAIVGGVLVGLFLVALILAVVNGKRQPQPQQLAKAVAPVPPPPLVPPTPARTPIPDFSKVDYSIDFSKVNYTKGPQGQPIFERSGKSPADRGVSAGFPVVEQGFTRDVVDLPLVSPDPEAEKAGDDDTVDPDGFVRHGKQTVYYPRGFGSAFLTAPIKEPRKYSEQLYYDGRRHGLYKEYHSDGETLVIQIPFKHGNKHGLLEKWRSPGNKEAEEPSIDGKLHGIVRAWHNDGRLRMEGAWVMGRREGILVEWTQTGERHETDWIDGQVVFRRGGSSSHSFIWKMRTTADGTTRDGGFVYRSVDKFVGIFGKPTMFRELRGGPEWYYDCSDGRFGFRVLWDGKGGCVIPSHFIYLR